MSYSGPTSPQINLVLEWAGGFKKDSDTLAKLAHKDFRYITYPRSVGRPEYNKEEFLKYMGKTISLWTEHKVSHVGYFSNHLHSS